MAGGGSGRSGEGIFRGPNGESESLADVLASIRALVSAETATRMTPDAEPAAGGGSGEVLMLTPQMRVVAATEPARSGEVLAEGLEPLAPRGPGAPILDEEALRGVINALVREELQGELGDRISRNLRKLIRRELAGMMAEHGRS